MMENKQRLFRIGEIAKIYHLPVKTLRFYSDCGLLTPAYIDPLSGYRYYSVDQFIQIDIIRNSKRMNMTLEEIGQMMSKELQASDIADVIATQMEVINRRIIEYEQIRNSMSATLKIIQNVVSVPRNVPYISEEAEQYYLSYPYQSTTPEEQEINFRKAMLECGGEKEQVYALYGVSTLADAFMRGQGIINPDIRSYVTNLDMDGIHIQSAGKYACIVFDDNVYEKEKYYHLLSEFIQKKSLIIEGDFSEEWIIPRMQAGRESTLIKLKIQVK